MADIIPMRRDNGGTRKYLAPLQARRHETLLRFIKFLDDSETQKIVQQDDSTFIALVSIAVHEYDLSQAWLAERLAASAAAVSRWTNGKNLPPIYGRAAVIRTMAQLMNESVAYSQTLDGLQMGTARRPPKELNL